MRVTLCALSLIIAAGIATSGLIAEAKGNSSGNVIYKPAGDATLNYGDGVTVHRHADGSVEVSDPPTVEPLYPNQQPQRRTVRRAARKKVAMHKTTTANKTTTVAAAKKPK